MWDLENDSKQELAIRYKVEVAPKEDKPPVQSSDTSHSENAPLLSLKRVPGRLTPSQLLLSFGDKTSTVIYNKENIARKTIARKTNPATRGYLKPQWNIIPDGTITNCTPHTITFDTNNPQNTVIRQNDLAIVTQTALNQAKTVTEFKPRLTDMVACKTVNECHSKQRKLNRFYFEEPAARATLIQSASSIGQNSAQCKFVKLAKANQKKQAKPKPKPRGSWQKRRILPGLQLSPKSRKRQHLSRANVKLSNRKNVEYFILAHLKIVIS